MLHAKTLARRTCVRSKQFYNGNRLRRAKNSLPLGFRSKCSSRGNRGYERREEYRLARLGSAARSKLRGIAATGSRGHKETDENKTSIVARVAVSINRMCGLDAQAIQAIMHSDRRGFDTEDDRVISCLGAPDYVSLSNNPCCVAIAYAFMRKSPRKFLELMAGVICGFRRITDINSRVTGGF